MPPKIDVVMVHDPVEGEPLDGIVPLVLAGHVHKRSVEHLKLGTTLFIQGSTGGAGLRALDNGPPTPLEASVLYFSRTTHELQAYDDITVGGLGLTSVSVERHIVTPPKPSAPPSSPPASPESSPASSPPAESAGGRTTPGTGPPVAASPAGGAVAPSARPNPPP